MSKESEIWSAALEIIKSNIANEITRNLWFGDLVLEKLISDKAYFQTPNLYKRKYIELNYMDTIGNALFDVLGHKVEIFVISTESRGFEEQFLELFEKEAAESLMEEEKRNPSPEAQIPVNVSDPIEPGPHRAGSHLRLKNPNLNFPKSYDPESNTIEDVPLMQYMEDMGNDSGMLLMTKHVSDYKSSYTFENFVVGDSNRMAYSTCLQVAKYPAQHCNPLFLYGPPGIGKTHLLYAIANYIGKTRPSFRLVYCTSEDFTNDLMDAITHKTTAEFREKYRKSDIFLIDDIQFISGKEATQLEFFNTFNTLYAANKQIIVTSDRRPMEIPVLEERIRSRFEGGAIIDISKPEPELRSAIIKRKAQELGIQIPNEAIKYIADQVKDNIRQIEGILKHINVYSMLRKEPVTRELVERIVSNVVVDPIGISSDKIINTVSHYTGISREDILSKKHTKNVTMARHITAYLMRELAEMTLEAIGKAIGRHHSTIGDSVSFIEEERASDPSLDAQIRAIIDELKN